MSCAPHHVTAAVFHAVGQPISLEKVLVADDQIEDGSMFVRISAATLCGSDVHTIEGKRKEPAPLVLGHEGVGVVEVSKADGVRVGDRVSFAVGVSSCTEANSKCGGCRIGMPQKCDAVFKFGHSKWEGQNACCDLSGTYASHIYLRPGSAVVPLHGPAAVLPDEVVVPANCALATMVCAMERAVQVLGRRPESIAIQGAGLLGLYGCSLAAEACCDGAGTDRGALAITVMDAVGHRLELAQEFGATCTINVQGLADSAVQAQAMEHLRGQWAQRAAGSNSKQPCAQGYDVVIEVCGFAGVLPLGVSLLRPGGVYVLVGLVHPASSLAGVTAEQLIRKNACMIGVHNYAPRHLQEGIQHLVRHYGKPGESGDGRVGAFDRILPFQKLVSAPLPLTAMEEAVACARTGQYARVLIKP